MSLLLVVVLLFFSSSCSVSSGQYYVSDDCSSVTQSPCNPLSVYAGDMSQYNNSIFYFIGTSDINDDVNMTAVRNLTLHGLDQSCLISSRSNERSILIYNSSHVIISKMSVHNLGVIARSSNNITITNSLFHNKTIKLNNTFDVNVSSSVFTHYGVNITYEPLPVCSTELPHYSLILTNVTLKSCWMELSVHHGTSYNLSAIFHYYNIISNSRFILGDSLFSFDIKNSSFQSALDYLYYSFHIKFSQKLKSVECKFPGIQLVSTFVIENSQFCDNWYGPTIIKDAYFPRTFDNHLIIIIKSCLIANSLDRGLFIHKRFLTSVQINITDTKLIGNGGNAILNSDAISLSNVTVANTRFTGLTLEASVVTIEDKLTFKNNNGVVGGGLAINGSSQLILTASANLEFIDNHASYKGGGIYLEETSKSGITLEAPNIPLTLINNSAGVYGDDIYGYTTNNGSNQFNLMSPHISSTGDVRKIQFCNYTNLKNASYKQIYSGQALKFHIVLLGYNYFGSLNVTDGLLKILDRLTKNSTHTVDYVYARTKPNTNCSSPIEYKPNHPPSHVMHAMLFLVQLGITKTSDSIYWEYLVNECPIGFSVDSSQGRFICACSQSVSRENVTCNITSLNIAHDGLLWIGTYDTSTPFNANANNLNACIINEDCLLYCCPNPVTFQLNDTDTQCVDNRGQRMCGSCTEGYSLLMGSNKCGQCHDNYMMIAWIALFAVMGVLLVVLLIALNLTVSVGTLNGLLFYANIVKLYEPVFSRKGALPVLSQVISWINLDFGFEICFYNGMDSYAKQWLQFAFPLYLWIIIIIIIQLCRRYSMISRLMGSHAVPVLSTLFLLSYTKLVRIIVIVLHKREVTLHCTDESVRSVSLWYEDPNVEYAKGKHAGLFGFALLVSVFFVIPYTLFLLLNRFYEKYLSNFKIFRKFWSRFKPIIDAYSGPMKDEYRFWPGLLLVARIPVLLSATLVDSFIQSHYFLLSMLMTVSAIVLSLGYCFGGVYKKRMNNIIEVWFLLNLCIMASLSVAFTDESKVLIWYNTCLSVFIFSFILIVVYHLHLQLSHLECYDVLIKKLFKKQDEDDDPLLDATESHLTVDQQRRAMVPSSTDYVRRESVVDLF